MELANGGSLDEYLQIQAPPEVPDFNQGNPTPQERIQRAKQFREQLKKRATANASSAESEAARMYGGIGYTSSGQRVRYLTKRQIVALFLGICEGLAHLHKNGIMHRDLRKFAKVLRLQKPPNLLLQFEDRQNPDEIPRVLISDFGECEIIGEKVQRVRSGGTGTLEFMSPELLERDEQGNYKHDHSLKGDMFSLGVVLYFLCYSRVPYSQVDDVDLLREEILSFSSVVFPPPDNRVPEELKMLIVRLLSRNPNDRPSVDEILMNNFMMRSRNMYTSTSPQRGTRARSLSFTDPRHTAMDNRDDDEDEEDENMDSNDEI
ncbi:hypothetical protein HDU76_011326, partial [Blyttiomyces sp. JEL0837]